MITLDNGVRTLDEVCWSWDGFDGCQVAAGGGVMGMELVNQEKILRDDRDILDILTMLFNSRIL